MEEDAYQLKIFPTSSLPQTPAGKKAAVEGLLQAGLIEKMEAQELLDLPDLEAVTSRNLAPYEIILDQIEQMIDENDPQVADPHQDLVMARKVTTLAYLRAKMDRVPEDRLELMRDFISSIDEIEQREAEASAALPQPPPTGGGVPVPAPEAMPPAMGAPPVAA